MPLTDDRSSSTLSDVSAADQNRVAAWVRRAAVFLFVALVTTAGTGRLGVHSTTATKTAGGWTLTVQYASVARPGLDVPLRFTVRRESPIGDELTVAVSRDYLNMFEQQGFYPDTSATSALGDDVLLTFDVPSGAHTLTVDFDGYIQPADQTGHSGTVAVLSDRSRVVETSVRTVLLP